MKRPTSSLILFALFVSSAALPGLSRAEGAAAPAAAPAAAAAPAHKSLIGTRCKDEAAKLCAGIEPGGGKLAKCLRGHDADLGEPCKAALASASGKHDATPAAAPAAAPDAAAAAPAAKAKHHKHGASSATGAGGAPGMVPPAPAPPAAPAK